MQSPSRKDVPYLAMGDRQDDVAYIERHAVRLIIEDPSASRIALVHISKGSYYKLPGGDVEGAEDHVSAASREALEETGCKVQVHPGSIAICEEYRNDLHQISYCYKSTVLEDTGSPKLDQHEVADGLTHEWVTWDEAKTKMEEAHPTSELGGSIKTRDSFLLGVAYKHRH